jgi:hypothetical protein
MRRFGPFQSSDLESLDELYSNAYKVIPMRDVHAGQTAPDRIAVRHDVDDNEGSFSAALDMAYWEYERGYRSTYFLLHTASYWEDHPWFWKEVRGLEKLGHEVGIHVNALAEATRTGDVPQDILTLALHQLRSAGAIVTGSVAHGDEACYADEAKLKLRFVNDEIFTECARPTLGAPDRMVAGVQLDPRPLADYGLEYDANRLPRKFYASDSGNRWNKPWEQTVQEALSPEGQLHLLIHPDWWTEAF